MARFEPPSSIAGEMADVFFVGKDIHGNWVAQDQRRRRCGLFVDQAAALRFVRFENRGHVPAVVLVKDACEIDLST